MNWNSEPLVSTKALTSVSGLDGLSTKSKNKTHKFCPRCGILKPIAEFYRNAGKPSGLAAYCKKCCQEYGLNIAGKRYTGLHKRSYPLDSCCELCSIELEKYDYHHFDDGNLNLGIWVCCSCDFLAERLDEIDKNPWKVDIYHKLKEEVEEAEKTYIYLGPFKPSDGIYKLFLNGKQTYKWCAHCGRMLPVNEFTKNHSSYSGLVYRCKECIQTSWIHCGSERFLVLHKRPKPNSCELCGSKSHLRYHHWDDNNRSKGVWVCQTNKCHNLAHAVDMLDSGSLLPDKYSKLRQEVIFRGCPETLITIGGYNGRI